MANDNEVDFSFNYFETLFYNAQQNAFLLTDSDGLVISINKNFTVSFGYEEDDIVGQSFSILFTIEDQKNGLFEKELHNLRTTGKSLDNNYLVKKDKTITWVSGESFLVQNKEGESRIVKLIQNRYALKRSENELRQLNEFNESILGSINDVVIVLDGNMNIIKANNAYKKLFMGDVKMAALNLYDLMKPYDRQDNWLGDLQKSIYTKRSFSNKQIEIDTSLGDKRFYEVTCTPLHDAFNDNMLLIIHDITAYKQVEREREDVLGFVAHELRNPLSMLILCNEIMAVAIENREFNELPFVIERSKKGVVRLNKMIAELYEATKVNSGYMYLEKTSVHFEDIVKESIETIKVMQPGYDIIVKGDSDVTVDADKYRIIQVLTNFLGNGIKYSNGNTEVTLTINHDSRRLIVSVKDEGLGISKEHLPFVFDRFFRAEKTRDIEGIGLGLYLCRQIIRAHKGEIWVESEEGIGSTFYFTLPLNNLASS